MSVSRYIFGARWLVRSSNMSYRNIQQRAVSDNSSTAMSSVEQRFVRILNSKIEVENKKSSVRIPGFKYDDFDRTGNLNIVKLHSVLDIYRAATFEWIRSHGFPDTVTMIMLGRHWKISPTLYERAAIDYPMVTSWWPTGLGRSSVDFMQVLTEEATGHLLATCLFRGIAFDTATMKSFPFEGATRDQALSEIVEGERFPTIHPPSAVPEKAFACKVRVRYDDMDLILHAKQSSYVAFIRECASQATVSGFYSRVSGDFANYTVESLTSMHVGESFAGDELKVSTFEDPSNALRLYFGVYKDEQAVCFAQMLLFDSFNTSKL